MIQETAGDAGRSLSGPPWLVRSEMLWSVLQRFWTKDERCETPDLPDEALVKDLM